MEQKLTQLAILLPSSLHSIASPHFFPFLLLWHALHGLLLALRILYSLQLCVYLFPNAPSSFFTCHKLEKEERGGRRREEGLLFPRTQSVRQSGPPTARCQRCRRQPPGPPHARSHSTGCCRVCCGRAPDTATSCEEEGEADSRVRASPTLSHGQDDRTSQEADSRRSTTNANV